MQGERLCGWPGPLCVDDSVAAMDEGGRLWWLPTSNWETLVGRVLDLCDDYEALAAVHGDFRYPYGGEIHGGEDSEAWWLPGDLQEMREYRERKTIVCSEAEAATPRWKCRDGDYAVLRAYLEEFEESPESSKVMAWIEGEGVYCYDASALRRRYVYVTHDGPLQPEATVEAAVDAYRKKYAGYRGSSATPPGVALGYRGPAIAVESPADDLVVLAETVSVTDGVVRGLAQNRSQTLWARNVAVTATGPESGEHVWRFPLAVQPGEVMPFEIRDWTGPGVASVIDFEISADLSPRIDLSRSLILDGSEWEFRYRRSLLEAFPQFSNNEDILSRFSREVAVSGETIYEMPHDTFLLVFSVTIRRERPTSHPRLVDAAREYTIEYEDLTVYGTTLSYPDGHVVNVFELTPIRNTVGMVLDSGVPAPLVWAGLAAQAVAEPGGETP